MKKVAYRCTSFILAFFFLASCSGNLQQSAGPAGEPGSEVTFSQFSDIPIPGGADLDLDRTIIIGKNNRQTIKLETYPLTLLFNLYGIRENGIVIIPE